MKPEYKLYATKRTKGYLIEVFFVDKSRSYITRTESSGKATRWYADRSAAAWVENQKDPSTYELEGQSDEG